MRVQDSQLMRAQTQILDSSGDLSPVQRVRIVFITTVPETASAFLNEQIRFLMKRGFEVHIITSPSTQHAPENIPVNGLTHQVSMRRAMTPVHDVVAVARLYRLLRHLRPEIVHTHTPKAGFVGMIAAWLARVPVRIYTVNGLAILAQPLWGRMMIAVTERITCALATEVLCVSRSVRRFLLRSGLCPREKCRILGSGGSHGVDVNRFNPAAYDRAERARIRERYGIPEDALVLGYIGRVVPAKGVAELAQAWNSLRYECPELRLVICGYCERDHPLSREVLEAVRNDPRVHFTSLRTTEMPTMYAAIDICVLPSHQEGLPNVALESAAMKVPMVATRVPGCVDAIRDNVTGLLVAVRNPEDLATAIRRLINDPQLRESMGTKAREFVARRFSEGTISRLLLEEYRRLMKIHIGARIADFSIAGVSSNELGNQAEPASAALVPEVSSGGMPNRRKRGASA
jgi:glycosyltransferase involved in cell wall biosynthesis